MLAPFLDDQGDKIRHDKNGVGYYTCADLVQKFHFTFETQTYGKRGWGRGGREKREGGKGGEGGVDQNINRAPSIHLIVRLTIAQYIYILTNRDPYMIKEIFNY